MKAVYTRKIDGGLSLINGAPKENIERDLSGASDAQIARDKASGHLLADLERNKETGLFSLTDEQYHRLVLSHAVQHETDRVTVLPDDVVLPSEEFFDAWTHDGKEFGHDLEKARAIQLERIRAARAPKLAELDVVFMRALESGDAAAQAEVTQEKDKLRAITDTLKTKALTSIEDVKAEFPQELMHE